MADISKITALNGTTYDIKDAKAIHNGTALMTTNPFAGYGHNASALYIPKIDNALYCAAKRFSVTVSGTYIEFYGADSLFNGNYDGNNLRIADDQQVTITIDFSNSSGSKMPGYPYGYIFMTFYATNNEPKEISARVYNNYASQTVGWKTITFNKVFGSVYMAEQDYYGLQTIEITLTGNGQTSYGYTALSQIDMWLTRPNPNDTPFLFKGAAQTLYYNLTAPAFIGSGASLTSLNANNISSGTVPVARLPVATSSANGIMTSTEKNKLAGIAEQATKNTNADIVDLVYPVGAIYMSTVQTSPATLFSGTTWDYISTSSKTVNELKAQPAQIISTASTVTQLKAQEAIIAGMIGVYAWKRTS